MKRMKLTLSLVAALLFSAAATAQTVDDVNAKFNEAGQLLQTKKFAEAIPVLEQVLDMGDKVGADAIETVEQAQKFLPTCYLAQGMSFAGASKFEDALASLTKAQELGELYGVTSVKNNASATIAKVYLAMGGSAYNAKDYATAADVFAKGYAAAPNNTQLALYLAESYDKLDSLDKAIDIYKGVMALTHSRYAADVEKAKSELATTLVNRAILAENFDDVIKYSNMVFEFDAQNPLAYLVVVQKANNAKNYAKVMEVGEAAAMAQTEPGPRSEVYFLLGAAYQNTDNKAKAIEAFKKVTAGDNVAAAKKLVTDLSK